jgi:hypothetical protein
MAITQTCFNNGAEFTIPANCCCTLTCDLTTDQFGGEDLLNLTFTSNFNVSNILIDGNPPSFPYTINPSATLQFTVCPGRIAESQTLELAIEDSFGITPTTITLNAVIGGLLDTISHNFGSVVVGNSSGIGITINPAPGNLLCCADFDVLELTGTFDVDPLFVNLCGNSQQQFNVTFAPTSVGLFNADITINVNECLTLTIPLTGRGIEQPSGGGGNPVSGPPKKVVDCPTDCKLFNPQPGFSQKTKNAINQISRATSPKGGPGRGTNFGRK